MIDKLLNLIVVVTSTFFASTTFSIATVDHPARMGAKVITEGHESFKRTLSLIRQRDLCFITITTSIINLLFFNDNFLDKSVNLINFLSIGGILIFTAISILPINAKLTSNQELSHQEIKNLMISWGKLHVIRTIPSVINAIILLSRFVMFT
ncbi:hypothetical protein AKO1_011520 [Acrasis kona]|uniref:DUF1772 domain-containing protein n=1 Tax=Acrasis kona TaxID=1008807 RepID=A0AAW2Z0H0_9EUKA